MNRGTFTKLSNAVNAKLSDIIINFNQVELSLKQIICAYIKSQRNDFVNDIVLNNSIISFSSKLSILQYILKKEKIEVKNKEDWERFHKLITTRNAVAHSDNLHNFEGDLIGEEVVDDEYDIRLPIYEPYLDGPKITIFKNGKVDAKGFDKMYNEFMDNLRHIEVMLRGIERQIKKL